MCFNLEIILANGNSVTTNVNNCVVHYNLFIQNNSITQYLQQLNLVHWVFLSRLGSAMLDNQLQLSARMCDFPQSFHVIAGTMP